MSNSSFSEEARRKELLRRRLLEDADFRNTLIRTLTEQAYRSSVALTPDEEESLGQALQIRSGQRQLQSQPGSQPAPPRSFPNKDLSLLDDSPAPHWASQALAHQAPAGDLSQSSQSSLSGDLGANWPSRFATYYPSQQPSLSLSQSQGAPSSRHEAPRGRGLQFLEADNQPGGGGSPDTKRSRPAPSDTVAAIANPAPRSLVSAFSSSAGSSVMSPDQQAAVRLVYDAAAFRARPDLVGAGATLCDCSRGRIMEEDGRNFVTDCNLDVGTILMLPTDPTFRWNSPRADQTNWHSYEVVTILPPPHEEAAESFVLASCGLAFPLTEADILFRRTTAHRLILPFVPDRALFPADPAFLRARRERLEADATAAATIASLPSCRYVSPA